MSEKRQYMLRSYGAVDMVFGAGLSAYLGVGLSQQAPEFGDLLYLAMGLASIALAIINVQSTVDDAQRGKLTMVCFLASLTGFGFAALAFASLSEQPAVPLVIIGTWLVCYLFFLFATLFFERAFR
ncbi:hypothetical protein [Stakelama tenebrarum]|uniref:Uncharacterized protein n=1 Tax=Stakelama tenebrarum TaxID=2711215 RepID=A0A6G6Y860_9SPHN|nr:hypothetical protein [Sphingosinithalassobacter tenebrarum]QIG80987.1 hypothetical protein G5C33_15110 [Sphingosinithalassobacter tenebrarum]